MGRFSPLVEEYSIDEGFLDLTGLRRLYRTGYKEIAEKIKQTIHKELGITVSVGVSLSKSLAKLCSKFKKPNGTTAVSGRHVHLLLERTPLEKVWGFGPNTVALLSKHGLKTALDFVRRPESFASKLLGKIGSELWGELRGEYLYKISNKAKNRQASISKTKTFTPPSSNRDIVWARALRNLESACIKLRRLKSISGRLTLFLRTQGFETDELETKLTRPTQATNELTPTLAHLFNEIYRPKILYRATGVILSDISDPTPMQLNLFEDPGHVAANEHIFKAVDEAAFKFGKHTVFLADCARLGPQHTGMRSTVSKRKSLLLTGETKRQRINLPLLGHKVV